MHLIYISVTLSLGMNGRDSKPFTHYSLNSELSSDYVLLQSKLYVISDYEKWSVIQKSCNENYELPILDADDR